LDEKEYSNIYAIPANYTDSGKIFGGMLEPRNAVETGILLVILGSGIDVDSHVRNDSHRRYDANTFTSCCSFHDGY
jgi:hypothetical protein